MIKGRYKILSQDWSPIAKSSNKRLTSENRVPLKFRHANPYKLRTPQSVNRKQSGLSLTQKYRQQEHCMSPIGNKFITPQTGNQRNSFNNINTGNTVIHLIDNPKQRFSKVKNKYALIPVNRSLDLTKWQTLDKQKSSISVENILNAKKFLRTTPFKLNKNLYRPNMHYRYSKSKDQEKGFSELTLSSTKYQNPWIWSGVRRYHW
jgi:hypothetical protein